MLDSGSLLDGRSLGISTCFMEKKLPYPTETTVVPDSLAMCRQTSSTESVQD